MMNKTITTRLRADVLNGVLYVRDDTLEDTFGSICCLSALILHMHEWGANKLDIYLDSYDEPFDAVVDWMYTHTKVREIPLNVSERRYHRYQVEGFLSGREQATF